MLQVIESKAVAANRMDEYLRQKIEMVRDRETKTREGERRAALDRTFIGADFDETEEGEDETKALPIERLSPKEIISNLREGVLAKLGVGKLSVQLDVTILWVRKEQRVLREKLQMQH